MKIVKFYAKWCGPCKKVDKILEGYDYESVDTDIDKDIANRHHITWLPTVIVFDDKENEIVRFDDEFTKSDLEKILNP